MKKLVERLDELLGPASFPPGILDEYSEDEVRAVVDAGMAREFEPIFRAWLHEKERERAGRAISAAERSAVASERSAMASEKAARFAMWAALISLVGIVVALFATR